MSRVLFQRHNGSLDVKLRSLRHGHSVLARGVGGGVDSRLRRLRGLRNPEVDLPPRRQRRRGRAAEADVAGVHSGHFHHLPGGEGRPGARFALWAFFQELEGYLWCDVEAVGFREDFVHEGVTHAPTQRGTTPTQIHLFRVVAPALLRAAPRAPP